MAESKECTRCKGHGMVEERVRNLAGNSMHGCAEYATVTCDQCCGKGYVTPEDMEAYYRTWNLR